MTCNRIMNDMAKRMLVSYMRCLEKTHVIPMTDP